MNEIEKHCITKSKQNVERNFYHQYWKHYIALEHKFLQTENFVTIEKDNFTTFSTEYEFLLQAICSEINVVTQFLAKEYQTNFTCKNIDDFIKLIIKNKESLCFETIVLELYDLLLTPWNDIKISNEGKITSYPKWWIDNNQIKHNRITQKVINSKNSTIKNYKNANLENVLNALAALYSLEMKCLKKINKRYSEVFKKESIEYDPLVFPEKSIFSISLQPEECFSSNHDTEIDTYIF